MSHTNGFVSARLMDDDKGDVVVAHPAVGCTVPLMRNA
jgi:hypothetical protein